MGESVPVSVYVQLYFSKCSVTRKGCSYCACLSGYQWNASVCSHHRPCQTPLKHRPCGCLVFGPAEAGYCQLLPPVPAALSLNSWLQTPGDTLNLTRLTSQETTNLNWFLWPTGSPSPILLQAGTRVSLTSSRDRAVLSIVNISHKWAREYVCCFEARGFRWELHQMVRVPLQVTDVAGLPDQLSVSCATSPGFQLSCCIPSAHLSYTASWSPRDGNEASLFNTPDSQCFVLAVQRCPAADTTYTCDLQSPGLSPLRAAVSVTVIQDGDTTCPEDSSAVAWNVTKAGHVAQAPCPGKRRGMVKRPCRPEGVWGPIHSSCTDTGLLALLLRAWLLRAGPGWPVDEVSQILAQLPEQAVVVTSPTDLLALVGTMTILAKVVADARIQLNSSALEPPLQAQIPRHSLAPLGHNGTNVSVTSLVLRKLDHLLPSNYGQGLGDSIYATPLVWRFVVRNKVAYLRHTALLNMVLCLLAADTCFLGAPLLPPGPHSPLCLAAAFLCHFLYLATFFWMLAQALMLAHQLLFVFHQLSKHRGFSLMVFLGYLYPMGFAGVALGLYLPRGQYLGEGACWLDKKGGALYTFVGPVLAIVGVNGLVLTVAVLKLLRPSLSEGPQVEKHQALLGVIKALLVLTPIFGLIWGLGLATLLEEVSIVPHYVFTVLNTSQVGDKVVVAVLFALLDGLSHSQSLLKEVSWWSRRNIGSGI
ncbi:Adhesion G-protein coupled receptor F3, partial [Eschrichtius robustus]|nr:Adhesion G-protein coupled receptor F3 [Eschrichtius robustus]